MKFTVKRDVLYNALKVTSRIITTNSPIESISGLLLEADSTKGLVSITGTDIRTRIQKRITDAKVTEDGQMVIPAVCCDIIRLMKGETVSLETDFNGQLKVLSEQCEYLLPVKSAAEYPKAELVFPEKMVTVSGLNALVRHVSFAAEKTSQEQSKVTQSVEITLSPGESNAAATDGKRMAMASNNNCADGSLKILLHGGALKALTSLVKSDEALFCGFSAPYVVFITQDMIFSTMPMQGDFPDMRAIISRVETAYTAVAEAKELMRAIEMAIACQLANDDSCINLRIVPDRIVITAEAYMRKSEIPVPATAVIPTEPGGFYYAPKYITDFLNLVSKNVILNIDRHGFLRLEANGTKYIVCPRRETRIHIPAEKAKKQEKSVEEKKPRKKSAKKSAVKAA